MKCEICGGTISGHSGLIHSEWGTAPVHPGCKDLPAPPIGATQDLVEQTIVALSKRFAVPAEDLRTHLEELAASASHLGHQEEALWTANYLKNSRVANSHLPGVELLKGIEAVIHRRSQ